MAEMLAVVAIIVVLLGISMVSVARYRDLLKITELDNAAREIYMAAENRAVLLSGARRLSNQLSKAGKETTLTTSVHAGANEDLYYVSKAQMTEDLLTVGSIDPALRADGVDFYIVYDRNSGSVTDVFYAEESMSGLVGGDFEAFYGKWAKSRSDRLKQKDEMLVGWYNGQAAQGRDEEVEIPEEPRIRVIIENGEELTVRVEYEAPAPAILSIELGSAGMAQSIPLPGDRLLRDVPLEAMVQDGRISVPAGAGSFAWMLDSLTEGAGRFKELGSAVTPGDDFAVEAAIIPEDGESFETASDRDENNSLFQEGSGPVTEGGEQARVFYVGYLRHLQNLDAYDYNSGVPSTELDTKIRAVQTQNILGDGGGVYPKYNFTPIFNSRLKKYDGRNYEIRNLHVEYEKDFAGLFSKPGEELCNIRMVNTTVKAGEAPAGALAGEANGTRILNCRVYWEADETVPDLKAALVKDGEKDEYHYQITGKYVGGLVGRASDAEISNCLAATLVSGVECAGGLVGVAGNAVAIRHSYADCYLTGAKENPDSSAAGLVGELNGSVALTDCYAAGYIIDGNQAAGLCLGDGTTEAKNVYSVVRYPGRNIGAEFTFLTQKQASDTFENTHFLYNRTGEIELTGGKTISGVSFDDMSASDFAARMGSSFQSKGLTDSHPYELRTPLDVYDYPGLTGMPHYGDWGRELARLSLVYYEQDGGTKKVSGIGVRDLDDSTVNVTEDGYALLLRQEAAGTGTTVNVTYSYLDREGEEEIKDMVSCQLENPREIVVDGEKKICYVIPLPPGLTDSDYAEEKFFRYIHFALSESGGAQKDPYEGDAFFNPHFAETVQTARLKDGAEGGWNKENVAEYARALAEVMGEIKVRTPRHLYGLSRFSEYCTRDSVYHQILDLDYATYTGYNNKFRGAPYSQQPIGRFDEAFAGTYNGDCRVIRNVVPEVSETSQRRYAGLFGYSGGTLRSIVYEMDPKHQVTAYLGNAAQNLYVGALAGGSSGTIDNCAVSGVNLRAGASGVVLYVGGLVGQNSGTIRNCSAESARLSANCFQYASIYIGGLVGENAVSRSVTTSYAVGRIDAEIDNTVKAARICGFVGWNYGSISNCYAAVDLRSSGDNVEVHGFCGMRVGTQSGNAYLDQGNFFYRDTSYAAKYHREGDKAESVTYVRLSDPDFTVPGMEKAAVTDQGAGEEMEEKEYPFPTAVKDKTGKYVHYGHWPTPMPLGEMGVFYWEKLVDAEGGGNPAYHISALAVDPVKKTIAKRTTLSEAHNDGRVVTDYGYGYYSSKDVAENVSLSAENIGYTGYLTYDNRKTHLNLSNMDPNRTRNENSRSDQREISAEAALADLMDSYAFHCWNTYREAPKRADNNSDDYRSSRAVSGLCLFKESADAVLDPNSGTFTLTQTGSQTMAVKFIVNPQFADAMSVAENPENLTVSNGASKSSPGSEDNPYQVRSGLQLQDINWYDTAYIDVPVGLGSYSAARFPYLNKDYCWKQSHDIDWVVERKSYDLPDAENDDGVFIPIAQGFARDGNMSLSGWFDGTYNGGSYTLKNFSIGLNANTYQINTMGLFGYVRNAVLTNIVMFSETGDDVVTVRGRAKDKNTGDSNVRLENDAYAWYAGGVLAGVARNSEISNCAVAGYTIRDETTHARSVQAGNRNNRYYTMGGAIGGLVGMTDTALENCTAAATIEIVCDHSSLGSAAPIRVGGLVGSATAGVTNCYAGGEIVTSIKNENGAVVKQAQNAVVCAGRLVGGVGMGPFNNTETAAAAVTVSNCYSYLALPGTGEAVKAVYNIGGAGRAANAPAGTVTTTNDYYCGADAGAGGGTSVTYQQLAGRDPIGGETIYQRLNSKPGQTGEASYNPYYPVTSRVGGLNVAGRFSYAPGNRKDLQGMDYPFPTILTQTRVSDGMVFRVHYGGWELNGIERAEGNQPIELDMFTKRADTEALRLSPGITGGSWSAEVSDESVAAAEINNGELTVTALKANDTPVTVTVKYTAGDKAYFLPITVSVTANVELRPNAVGVFSGDVVSVPLAVVGRTPDNPNAKDEERPLLSANGLANIKVNSLDTALAAELAGTADAPAIALRSGEVFVERVKVNVTYDYTKDGCTVTGKIDQADVTPLTIPEGVWSEDGTVWTMDFSAYKPVITAAAFANAAPDGFETGFEGTAVKVTKPADTQLPAGGVRLKVNLTMEGLKLKDQTIMVTHELTVIVPPKTEGGEEVS